MFWDIGNLIVLTLNRQLVGIFVNLLGIPYRWLVVIILILVIFIIRRLLDHRHIWIMVIAGRANYLLRKFGL